MNEIVTPEYLLKRGFEKVSHGKSPKTVDFPHFNKEDTCFVEKFLDRQHFVIIFHDPLICDSDDCYSVFVQEDAGCGYVCVPSYWSPLSIDRFEALYFYVNNTKP